MRPHQRSIIEPQIDQSVPPGITSPYGFSRVSGAVLGKEAGSPEPSVPLGGPAPPTVETRPLSTARATVHAEACGTARAITNGEACYFPQLYLYGITAAFERMPLFSAAVTCPTTPARLGGRRSVKISDCSRPGIPSITRPSKVMFEILKAHIVDRNASYAECTSRYLLVLKLSRGSQLKTANCFNPAPRCQWIFLMLLQQDSSLRYVLNHLSREIRYCINPDPMTPEEYDTLIFEQALLKIAHQRRLRRQNCSRRISSYESRGAGPAKHIPLVGKPRYPACNRRLSGSPVAAFCLIGRVEKQRRPHQEYQPVQAPSRPKSKSPT